MEDVLDLYALPYNPHIPVVCFDERPCQLLDDILTPIPMKPGQPERMDYQYERKGTANIFGILEPLAGQRHLEVTERRTKQDFARCLKRLVDEWYPEALLIRVVLDNLNTHSKASLYETFPVEEARRIARKLEFHHTPKHGSWLNAVEIDFAALAKQCLDRRIGSLEKLKDEVNAWEKRRNKLGIGVKWMFTIASARIKLERLYPEPL